jgi:DNA-binding response OmpR family regulator
MPRPHRAILAALLRRPGVIVSHDRLLTALGSDSDASLKVQVCSLRKARPEVCIENVSGIGYRATMRRAG